MNKSLEYILKEMCKRVGADYNSIDFKKEQWFYLYEWTEKEQNDFVDWLANELYKNSKLRKELNAIRNKRYCSMAASMFCFNYGWKVKYDK